MDRVRRLSEFWSWLPAFRAVAESEHLPTASRELAVSVPAISRTVRLLEESLGRSLFERVGRSLVLNPRGRGFLDAVREAMRQVDEGVEHVIARAFVGAVTVSVAGPLASIAVLPALSTLRASHPGIVPEVVTLAAAAAKAQLARGHVDLAVLDDPIPSDTLALVRLGRVDYGVWCRPAHPLVGSPPPSLADLRDAAFVAPTPGDDGRTPDRWPVEAPRRVVLRVADSQTGIDAALADDLLMVLPDATARARGLVRLPLDGVPPATIFLQRRPPLAEPGRIDAVADAIRAVAAPRLAP